MREHTYRLATYAHADGEPRAGIVVDDELLDAAAALQTGKRSADTPAVSV
jgi:hypothetical protein